MIRTMLLKLIVHMSSGSKNSKILKTLDCFGTLLSTKFDKIQFLRVNVKQGKERPKWQI